jgi:hypothetical protein
MPENDEAKQKQELRERAVAAIQSKWAGSKACPFCLQSKWTIGELSAVPGYVPPNLNLESLHPTVPLVCETCGNTLWFNAIVAGVVERPAAEPPQPEPPEAPEPSEGAEEKPDQSVGKPR